MIKKFSLLLQRGISRKVFDVMAHDHQTYKAQEISFHCSDPNTAKMHDSVFKL